MADQTATVDTDLESIIALGLTSADTLTINAGVTVTITETPSILLGQIDLGVGSELFVDGANISAGTSIHLVKVAHDNGTHLYNRYNGNVSANINIQGAWLSIGSTDGLASQTIDITSYWADGVRDYVPMIQVETGRRIDFDNVGGTTAPEVNDLVFKDSDEDVFGRVVEVQSTYIVVKWLTGTLADNDAIWIDRVVDNVGPELQRVWTANVNNASGDIKEAGIYQEFGNVYQRGADCIESCGQGVAGFAFTQAFQSNTITMASATGGFLCESGCDIRIPNIHMSACNADGVDYGNGISTPITAVISEFGGVINPAGATVNINIVNMGTQSAKLYEGGDANFSFLGCVDIIGSGYTVLGTQTLTSCVWVQGWHTVVGIGFPNSAINGYNHPLAFVMRDCMQLFTGVGAMSTSCIEMADVQMYDNIFVVTGHHNDQGYGNDPLTFNSCGSVILHRNFLYNHTAGSGYRALQTNGIGYMEIKGHYYSKYVNAVITPNEDSLYLFGVQSGYIEDIRVLHDSPDNLSLLRLQSSSNVKVRAVGSKLNRAVAQNLGVYCEGVANHNHIARCHFRSVAGTYTGHTAGLSGGNNQMINCSHDFDNTMSDFSNIVGESLRGNRGMDAIYGSSYRIPDRTSGGKGKTVHDLFVSDTLGALFCFFHVPRDDSTEIEIVTGTPFFDGSGRMNLTSGDVVIIHQDYFMLGHTGFTGVFGAGQYISDTYSASGAFFNLEFQYQLLGGAWSGTWLNVTTAANLTGITGAIELGIRFMFRITCTNDLEQMDMIYLETTTTASAQDDNLYPIDQIEYTLTIPDAPIGSTVIIYDYDNVDPQNLGTELQRVNSVSGDVTYTYVGTKATDDVWLQMYDSGHRPIGRLYELPAQDSTFFLNPETETN